MSNGTASVYAARNAALKALGFASYAEYLQSEQWIAIRSAVLCRDRVCFGCGKSASQVHHLWYSPRALEGKDLRALVAICGGCHEVVEHSGDLKRSPGKASRVLTAMRNWRTSGDLEPPGALRARGAECPLCHDNRPFRNGPCPPCRKRHALPL
jgi:hypothetical protein